MKSFVDCFFYVMEYSNGMLNLVLFLLMLYCLMLCMFSFELKNGMCEYSLYDYICIVNMY